MIKTSKNSFQNFLLHVNKITDIFKFSLFLYIFIVSLFITSGLQKSYAADIVVSPTTGSFNVGKTFSVDVNLNKNQDNINAVSGALIFSSDLIKIVSISKAGSLITMWAQEPTFSNTDGTVSFEGISLNSGFSEASGKVLTITFKTLKAGKASVSMKSGSVLANDGNATNVLGSFGSASFNIAEDTTPEVVTAEIPAVVEKPGRTVVDNSVVPVIKSTTHPDSEKWYANREVSFEWALPSSVIAVRTLYGEKESSTPTKLYEPAISTRNFTTDIDGIMYMHVQFKTVTGWGSVAHYKFQIDTEAPIITKASFPSGSIITSSTPAVFVKAEDKLSGLDSFSMSIDGGASFSYPVDPLNLYTLPKQGAGKHTIVISATDKAGNVSTKSLEYTIQPIATPVVTDYTKNLTTGSRLQISGTTYPKTTVEATIVRRSVSNTLSLSSLVSSTSVTEDFKDTETVTSDESGKFNLTWSKNLDSGIYELKLRSIDSSNSPSEFTDSKVIVVENVVLIRFGMFIMNWLSLLLMIIITIFAIVATFWFSFVQFSSFRRKVRRTMAEVEETLKTNVASLKKDLGEFSSALLKAEKKRDLTKEEKVLLKKFTKHLESTEKDIDKKLESL